MLPFLLPETRERYFFTSKNSCVKTILTAAFINFFALQATGQIQISNSKWKGQTEVPRTTDIDLEFSKDTFKIFSGRGIEVMLYSQYNDSLFIRKISGNSQCPEGAAGWYRIEWLENGEKFLLHVINDSCTRRVNGIEAIRINQRIRPSNDASRDWSYKSFSKDSIPGINLTGAYDLLKGRKSETVIVAVLGGGIDRKHEDLKDVMWINTKEIPDNGIDDDKNGYIDDTWGWNFLSDKKGNTIPQLQQEATYIYKIWKGKYDNANVSKLNPSEKEEYALYQKAKKEWESNYQYVAALKTVLKDSAGFLNTVKEFAEQASPPRMPISVFETYDDGNDPFKMAVKKSVLGFFQEADSVYLGFFLQNQQVRWRSFKNFANRHLQAYDLEYDPFKIVGDDPLNLKERNYGSPYIIMAEGETFNHDTHICGIIGAKRNNGIGIDGIADNVRIMMVVGMAGGDERDKDIANGIRYAVDNGAKIINMSWGKRTSSHKKAVDEAIRYAEDKDVLLVNAAGNSGDDCDTINYYPVARYKDGKPAKNFLETGCSQRFLDSRLPAVYSNYGQQTVHLFAPGHDSYGPLPENNYGYSGGTSNAAPFVVGVAALLKSYFPELTMLQIKDIILETVQRPNLQVIRPHFIAPVLSPARRAFMATQGELVPFSNLSISGGILDAEAAVRKAMEVSRLKPLKGF
jgi:subtilisin family serine protease